MKDSRHLENRQNAIFHNDVDRVSQAYRSLAILDFILKFLMGGVLETHVLHHHAKFCGGRSDCCRDIAIFEFFNEM